ncbi:MAG: PP2C family protein-serine/threonine phosphatase [Candidatus Acidiferrales bacterium]
MKKKPRPKKSASRPRSAARAAPPRRPPKGPRPVEDLADQGELARAVQRSLLSTAHARGPGYELVGRFAPALEVAGDFYDHFVFGGGLVGFYVGDVQGKGLAAAMYAALVSGIMRGLQKAGCGPGTVLDFLNRRLCLRPIPGKFCALAYVTLDPVRRRLAWANAGLPYPLLCRHGKAKRLKLDGLPIGLFPETKYAERELGLEPGDVVLLYTDGLTDSLEHRGVRDGEALVRRLLESARGGSVAQIADRLLAQLVAPDSPRRRRLEPLHDDASFLLLKIV